MKVAFDIDGVLCDFVFGFSRVASVAFDKLDLYSNGAQSDWAFGGRYTSEQIEQVWDLIHASPDFWETLLPLIPFGELMQMITWAERHEVWYVTNRRDYAVEQTGKWLTQHKLPQPDHIVHTEKKADLLVKEGFDALIEDSPGNLFATVGRIPLVAARDWPYNREVKFPGIVGPLKEFARVSSVGEFLVLVDELATT